MFGNLFNQRKKIKALEKEVAKLREELAKQYNKNKADYLHLLDVLSERDFYNEKAATVRPLQIAANELGTAEIAGAVANERIVEYFTATSGKFTSDEVSWCSAFVNWCLREAGFRYTNDATAKSFLNWGEAVTLEQAELGDVVVLNTKDPTSWQGHVGFYIGSTASHIVMLGGNQGNQVKVASYPIARLNSIRHFRRH